MKKSHEVLEYLLAGNRRYVAGGPTHPRQGENRRKELVGGQAPMAVVLACSDARVVPEVIFDQGIGDLFVIRVAGNVADALVLGSIEYAVAELEAPLVMVLGHTQCGAVKATLDRAAGYKGHIWHVASHIKPAIRETEKMSGDPWFNAIKANTTMVAAKLAGTNPILSKGVSAGRLSIVAAIYDIGTGMVNVL